MVEPEQQGASIVLVGSFNPAIYSPEWFARVGLIKLADAQSAETTVIHPELTVVRLDAMQLQIAPQRFIVSTVEVPMVRVADFAADLLGHVIPHTPIQAMGINFEEVFLAPTPKHRLDLGRLLAPTKPWGIWGEEIESAPANNPSGLIRLAMQQNNPGGRNGNFTIEVAPSAEIDKFRAVKLSSNDHYVIEETAVESSATVAARLVAEEFEKDQRKVHSIFSHLRSLSEGTPQ